MEKKLSITARSNLIAQVCVVENFYGESVKYAEHDFFVLQKNHFALCSALKRLRRRSSREASLRTRRGATHPLAVS